MANGDPRDPWWVPVPFEGEPAPRRVAFTKESYGYPIHPELLSALDRAAAHLVDAGYQVEEVKTPSIAEPAQGWFDVAIFEMKETIGPVVEQSGSETLKQIFHWYYDFGDLVDADGYREGIAARTTLTRLWNVFLDEYPLVLTPFLMRPTYSWNYDAVSYEQAHDLFNSGIYSFGVNYLGLPAGVVPVGLVDGLPAGVQIIGRRFREDLILDAMESVEARVGVLAHELWQAEASAAD
jgi:amidase